MYADRVSCLTGRLPDGDQQKCTLNDTVPPCYAAVVFRLARADLDRWLVETFPVILVIYDAHADLAYWFYVQAQFQRRPGVPASARKSVTVHIPTANVLDADAIRYFAAAKAAVQAQTKGVRHGE